MKPLSTPPPILVTGAHRSGTTWVGKMLASGKQTAYISEPLNLLHRPGVLRAPVTHWYTYLCPDNEADFLPALNEMLAFRYHLASEIASLRSTKDFGRMLRDLSIFQRGRIAGQRPLIKDPFAVFSIPWFVDRLGCTAIITVRHPAAFASSLKRLNWSFDFNNLLAQPLLMRDWLGELRTEMQAVQQAPDDILAQAALLWRAVYDTAAQILRRFPQVIMVRHEDLSLDPIAGFRELYRRLDLQFTPQVERAILASSSSENPTELSQRSVHGVRLDSAANLHNWKRRLTALEIHQLREMTAAVACEFYPEISWE